MQAKVISVISQFFRQRSPKSFLRYCSTRSVAYVAEGFEESRALSVPMYILPISLGLILFFTNKSIKALAAKEDGSSSESGIDIFSKPNPLLSFSYSKSLFLESSLIERYILGT